MADGRVIVWGGLVPHDEDPDEPALADGAILDWSTAAWEPMAASPLPGGRTVAAVAAGQLFVVNAGQAALFDGAQNAWTLVPAPEPLKDVTAITPIGQDVYLWPLGLVLDLTTLEWRRAALPASLPAFAKYASNGEVAAVWGVDESLARRAGFGYLYQPDSDSWITIDDPPLGELRDGFAFGLTAEALTLVTWSDMSAAALDLETQRWQVLPSFPGAPSKCLGSLYPVNSDHILVKMCNLAATLDIAEETWKPIDPVEHPGEWLPIYAVHDSQETEVTLIAIEPPRS